MAASPTGPARDAPSSKPLHQRLGVRPGSRVAAVGPVERGVLDEVRAAGAVVDRGRSSTGLDIVLFAVREPAELDGLAALRLRLAPAGGVWVITPRGRRDLRDVEVIAAARSAGLVDNKVLRFSDTDTALRLVIPRADR